MLWTPSVRTSYIIDNWPATPTGSGFGQAVVPGLSNVEGSWTEVLSDLAQEIVGIWVNVTSAGNSGFGYLLDIGWDPAGGTSYVAEISNIVCGQASGPNSSQLGSSGWDFYFPIRIPAGAAVAARAQTSGGSSVSFRIAIRAYGQPDAPWLFPAGQYSETVGTITNSDGVSFTPGNAADGSWTSLGTTTRECWWWQIGVQVNGTRSAEQTYVELAYGDGSNKHIISRTMTAGAHSVNEDGAVFIGNMLLPESYCRVPAGSTLYIRGRCVNAPDSGYNAVAIGIGG